MTTEKKSFQEIVAESPVPVLVDVYSETCGPCHAMKPVLAELKDRLGEGVRIIKIDGYRNTAYMQQHAIRAFPTLQLWRNGRIVWTREGYANAHQLEQVVRQHAG